MMVSPSICFQMMEQDPQVEHQISSEIGKLEAQFQDIIGCDVVVYGPAALDSQTADCTTNRLYDVRIVLALPCREIVVETGPNADPCVHTAVKKGFEAMRLQFELWLKDRASVSEDDC